MSATLPTTERSSWPVMPALILALAIAGVGVFATLLTMLVQNRTLQPQEVVRRARVEFATRRFDLARRLALAARIDTHEDPKLEAERQWLLGEIQYAQANARTDPRVQRIDYHRAVRHLELAVQLGLPPRLVADGQARLAQALYRAGRYGAAVEQLRRVLEQQPARARELWLPLAESSLRSGAAPGPVLALLDQLLALPDLTPQRTLQTRLLKAEALAADEQWSAAEQELAGLSENPAWRESAALKEYQLRLDRARRVLGEPGDPAEQATLRRDMDRLIEQLSRATRTASSATEGPIRYLLGDALRLAERDQEALLVLATVRQNRRGSGEAIAANLVELELYVARQQLDEALETAGLMVREVGNLDGFDPSWMTLEQFQRRLIDAVRQWQQAGRYEQAIALVRALPPLIPLVDALRMEGETFRDWAKSLDDPTADGPPGEEPPMAAAARDRYRHAGDAWAAAAQLRFEQQEYSELLWSSIEAYQLGRAYERSLRLLNDYLQYEFRELRPRGLLAKGRALLATDRPSDALAPLEDLVIDFPRDPLRFDARVVSALAQGELGQYTAASQSLEENLHDPGLAPSSPHWRDSLLLLGDIHYRQAFQRQLEILEPRAPDRTGEEIRAALAENQPVLLAAIDQLDEARQRDPEKRSIRRAAYLCGQSRRLAAQWPALQSVAPETLDGARRQLNQQRASFLEAALLDFQQLRVELNDLAEQTPLADWEQSILRNSYLAEADTLFDLGRYQEAAEAYRGATHRFLGEPLALEAMAQEARCYRELRRPDEARRVVKQAQQILDAIPADRETQFLGVTRYDRAGWNRLLALLARY